MNVLNEIFKEAKRTFFICGIHLLYLLCLKPDNACDEPKRITKLSNLQKSIIKYLDQGTYFMCQIFIPYVGYLVIAIQYCFLINVVYNWYFPSLVRSLRGGTFGFYDDYSVKEDKRFLKEIRGLVSLILDGLRFSVETSLAPIELHFLRLWELQVVARKKDYKKPGSIALSLSHKIPDPKYEFSRFGTASNGISLPAVISDEQFSCRKDFCLFAIKWTSEMVKGVQYLHDRDIYHLNLQPESILLNFGSKFEPMASKAVIGNFLDKQNNLAKDDKRWPMTLPACYRPPEAYLFGEELPKAAAAERCDVWGIGIVSLELFTGGYLMNNQQSPFNPTDFLFNSESDYLLNGANFLLAVEGTHRLDHDLLMTDKWAAIRQNYIWSWWFLSDLLECYPNIRIGIRTASQHGFMKQSEKLLANKL